MINIIIIQPETPSFYLASMKVPDKKPEKKKNSDRALPPMLPGLLNGGFKHSRRIFTRIFDKTASIRNRKIALINKIAAKKRHREKPFSRREYRLKG